MRSFSILPHTADLRIRLEGDTLPELFTGGVEALASVLNHESCTGKKYNRTQTIRLSSIDTTSLLIDFLSEILAHSYTENVIYCAVEFKDISETHMDATIQGTDISQFDEDVKAVTYHEARIEKNGRGWFETLLVLDI